MRQIITSRKKNISTGSLFLGYSLIAIALYIAYRVSAFVVAMIEIPQGIEKFGFAAFTITIILIGMNMLLRYDVKHTVKRIPIRSNQIH